MNQVELRLRSRAERATNASLALQLSRRQQRYVNAACLPTCLHRRTSLHNLSADPPTVSIDHSSTPRVLLINLLSD